MIKSDKYSSIFFLIISIIFCQQSLGMNIGSLSSPGPGLLPLGIGIGTAFLSIALFFMSFRYKNSQLDYTDKNTIKSILGSVFLCLSLFAYVLAVNFAGFILATFLYSYFLFYFVETEKWWQSVLKALLVTIGNFIVFVVWLDVKVPIFPIFS